MPSLRWHAPWRRKGPCGRYRPETASLSPAFELAGYLHAFELDLLEPAVGRGQCVLERSTGTSDSQHTSTTGQQLTVVLSRACANSLGIEATAGPIPAWNRWRSGLCDKDRLPVMVTP